MLPALLLPAAGLALASPAAAATVPAPVTTPARTVGTTPAPVRPVTPVAPVRPAGTPAPAPTFGDGGTPAPTGTGKRPLTTNPVSLVLLLGSLSLLPGLLVMTTAFTRIVVVLGFTRTALGTQGVPPNQVVIGLALFLTLFVMGPAFSTANKSALQPYLHGEISQSQAYHRGVEPFRAFMLKQVRQKDLQLFVSLSGKAAPATPADLPLTTLVPAFVISELRTAFLIGFVVFIPFLVIDVVVAAALSAMGMAMLPPSLVSLPFKLLLFVAVDGWWLITGSLVRSFA